MTKPIAAACVVAAALMMTTSADAQSAGTSSTATTAAIVSSPPPPPPPPAPEPRSENQRLLSTATEAVPRAFVVYENERIGAFIKPVLQISSTVVGYVPSLSGENDNLSGRTSTLLLARFGVEGRITDWISFRSVFERNVGFSLSRNGPVGTSVWEGTASLQARENYIRLERWGLNLSAGIVPDPASIDFISDNTLDMFGMDPYVRDPLLASGFNQGQGVLLRYSRWGLTGGLSFTGGNPLTTSLAFGFGGQVSTLGTLFSAPLRALANGIPGSDIHLVLFSPSLSYEHDYFDVKVAAQLYDVDINLANDEDKQLRGYNLRATAQAKLLDEMVRVFVSGSMRSNQQIDVTNAAARLDNDFKGMVFAAGADFTYQDLSAGGQFYWVRSEATVDNALFAQYANFGVTYWLWERSVSAGLRWGYSKVTAEDENLVNLLTSHSFIGSLRLML
ncbi:MAG: hypothetical protein RIT81_23480 [Deltaproteobacteria bacterium]